MKLSIKIIIATAVLFLTFLVGSLMIVKSELQSMVTKAAIESNFKTLPVEKFQSVEIVGHWEVTIKQGSDYKLEIRGNEVTDKNRIKNSDGWLTLNGDSTYNPVGKKFRVKIITPDLKVLRAKGCTLSLKDISSDSMSVQLLGNVNYKSENIKIKHMNLSTSGENVLEIIHNQE